MLPDERKREIAEIVTEENGSTVADLAGRLDVSEATIRRDLRDLEDDGRIERSHGGALPVKTVGEERTYGQKQVQGRDAKRIIGERAAETLQDGQVVFFDSGTTTIEVAKHVPDDVTITAATNSPLVSMQLAEAGIEVKVTGGTLRRSTWSLVGPTGESFLDRTNFDVLFLGTNGIHPDAGLTTPNEDEARIKSRMCEKASRVVLVADNSKFGRRSFFRFASFEDVDTLVTDAPVPAEYREPFETMGVEIIEEVGE
ncbi:HTH-type transcriptional regulator GlpR [Haladaptatus sp. AB643]|uniref:HTH-type transcriptional regulator GlpR n=1 Tax=Haladaptatus sp. AB643 TaxID=2934174 RepID=UPI00209BBE74|nr:HTH-type transcriptional regulator GlpR [Haladaptatus sp. AB643]MCO8246458.1 DeoR/GlpR family DNA-binding transcription regulator [Haladaptatus sp. AB643]